MKYYVIYPHGIRTKVKIVEAHCENGVNFLVLKDRSGTVYVIEDKYLFLEES